MSDIRRTVRNLGVDVRKVFRMFKQLDRAAVAAHYVRGSGIEVGGLHNPLKVPRGASVRYIDRMSTEELRKQYPELAGRSFTRVDILDDGERLRTIADGSQDFVIANHFLEHCENPIGTLHTLFRVVKKGGVVYMCLPDKRYTFDSDREITSFEHILRDYEEGPAWSRRGHFEEWVRIVERVSDGEEAARRVQALMDQKYSIHYHVWTQPDMWNMLHAARDVLQVPFEIEFMMKSEGEVIIVIRKNGT